MSHHMKVTVDMSRKEREPRRRKHIFCARHSNGWKAHEETI